MRSAASRTQSAPTTTSTPTSGLVATYVGTREENVEEACGLIAKELERLRAEPVSDEELARGQGARQGPHSPLVGVDRHTDVAQRPRGHVRDPHYTLDEMLEKVDAVTVDDVTALSEELYDPRHLSAACIGRSEDLFRSAVAGVAEPLATA